MRRNEALEMAAHALANTPITINPLFQEEKIVFNLPHKLDYETTELNPEEIKNRKKNTLKAIHDLTNLIEEERKKEQLLNRISLMSHESRKIKECLHLLDINLI